MAQEQVIEKLEDMLNRAHAAIKTMQSKIDHTTTAIQPTQPLSQPSAMTNAAGAGAGAGDVDMSELEDLRKQVQELKDDLKQGTAQ